MTGRWRRWVAWLTVPESATSMAIFRVVVGVAALTQVGIALRGGVVDDIWLGPDHGGIVPVGENWLVRLLGGNTPAVVHGLLVTVAAGGLALVVGLGGRLTAFATLQAGLALLDSNGMVALVRRSDACGGRPGPVSCTANSSHPRVACASSSGICASALANQPPSVFSICVKVGTSRLVRVMGVP